MSFRGIKRRQAAGTWRELTEEVRRWPGSSLVSHELFAGASAEQVGRLVEDLGGDDVHLVLTVRDLSRLLPAVWQERAKNGVVESWADFRSAVSAGPEAPEPHGFWSLHDAQKVIANWREHVVDERMHVVTLPAAGSDENALLDRFARLLGIDPRSLVVHDEAANASIGALELAVLRAVNATARDRLDARAYQAKVKRYLVPDVLAKRPKPLKVVLPDSDRAWVERFSEQVSTTLSGGSIEVIGGLDELAPTNFAPDAPDDPAQSGEFPEPVVAQALAEVLVDLLVSPPVSAEARRRRPAERAAVAHVERGARRHVERGVRGLGTAARSVVRAVVRAGRRLAARARNRGTSPT